MPVTVHYVLLNGPPNCGKSTAARQFHRELNGYYGGGYKSHAVQDAFSAPMKHFISVMLNETYSEMNKDKPRAELNGYSVREFFIHLAEEHMKVKYGEDIFARLLVHRVLRNVPLPHYVVVDDLGFDVEGYACDLKTIVHIHRSGCDFSSDSRSRVMVPHYTIHNDGTLTEYYDKIKVIVADMMKDKVPE